MEGVPGCRGVGLLPSARDAEYRGRPASGHVPPCLASSPHDGIFAYPGDPSLSWLSPGAIPELRLRDDPSEMRVTVMSFAAIT